MSGNWITNQQVEIYMTSRHQGQTQATSSAKAGFSERSGRNIDIGKRINPHRAPRPWRTRHDPLEAIWETELMPLLEQTPGLQPITLLEYIQSRYPGEYPDKVLRTLQRRTLQRRAVYRRWPAMASPGAARNPARSRCHRLAANPAIVRHRPGRTVAGTRNCCGLQPARRG